MEGYSQEQIEKILIGISESLDISPTKYKQAVERYNTIGVWLEDGYYPGIVETPYIYPQGSFRLGTVVRPIKEGREADYDIDLVSQLALAKENTSPGEVKHLIGDRLKENGRYKQMLDDEGKRCWTIEYAEQDGIGFHVDVLPSIPKLYGYLHAIDITDKDRETDNYDWDSSNPKGYAEWFDEIKKPAYEAVQISQRKIIQENYSDIYARVEDVPEAVIKTPLQRAIQIFKRHRDLRFSGKLNRQDKPISMIITTLSALAYSNESDLYLTIFNIIHKVKAYTESGLIQKQNGRWYIPNPVDPEENFADRWHEDNDRKAKAFFQWIDWVEQDLAYALEQQDPKRMQAALSEVFGERSVNESFSKSGFLAATVTPAIISRPHVDISEPSKPWGTNG